MHTKLGVTKEGTADAADWIAMAIDALEPGVHTVACGVTVAFAMHD